MLLGRLMHQRAANTSRRKFSRLGEECSASLSSKLFVVLFVVLGGRYRSSNGVDVIVKTFVVQLIWSYELYGLSCNLISAQKTLFMFFTLIA